MTEEDRKKYSKKAIIVSIIEILILIGFLFELDFTLYLKIFELEKDP